MAELESSVNREEIRRRLDQQLHAAQEELEQLEERIDAKGEYGPGKGDPLVVHWELNLARKEQAETRVAQLQEALERLEEGDYGECESCGEPIDPARLQALPGARLCIECARREA